MDWDTKPQHACAGTFSCTVGAETGNSLPVALLQNNYQTFTVHCVAVHSPLL